MQEQDPQVRATNFAEVACGYTLEEAMREAERCLLCPDEPCIPGCPVEIDIPEFIEKITEKSLHGAYETITDTNLLPAICGRVCPQESQCEAVCVVGDTLEPVAIGRLERFIGDMAIAEGWESVPYIEPSGFRVAVVGSGPAGMACAAEMAKGGCDVTIYEAFQEPGGVLKYGIPDFRLPNEVIDAEIEKLRRLGVTFEVNTLVGRLFTVEELLTEMGYHAVFIGTGAGVGGRMRIPGEELGEVYQATEFLVRGNLQPHQLPQEMREPLPIGKHVLVVGGGDTSMDCVRTAVRLGAESVTCMYRRTEHEQKGREEERRHAREEGVQFQYLTVPTRFLGDNGRVTAAECVRMRLGEPDESGRRRPEPVPGSEFAVPA
ncbi:hypothetical protein LCGC14_1960910, partial [marine sediment metagenome]